MGLQGKNTKKPNPNQTKEKPLVLTLLKLALPSKPAKGQIQLIRASLVDAGFGPDLLCLPCRISK